MMEFGRVVLRVHALERMFERELSHEAADVLRHGEVIEKYPDDPLFSSRLLLGWSEEKGEAKARPLHVVVAIDEEQTAIVITVYEPDPELWEEGFRRRRKR